MLHPEILLYFIAIILLLIGFFNEDKLIAFETKIIHRIKKAIVKHKDN